MATLVTNFPPCPYNEPMFNKENVMSAVWIKWFQLLWQRVGGSNGGIVYENGDAAILADSSSAELDGIRQQVADLQQAFEGQLQAPPDSDVLEPDLLLPPVEVPPAEDLSAGVYQYVDENSYKKLLANSGTAVLVAGTKTVLNTAVTANSIILVTAQALGTITAPVAYYISAKVAGTSFTITSAAATDTSTVGYLILN